LNPWFGGIQKTGFETVEMPRYNRGTGTAGAGSKRKKEELSDMINKILVDSPSNFWEE